MTNEAKPVSGEQQDVRVTIPRLQAGHAMMVRITERDDDGKPFRTGSVIFAGKSDEPFTGHVAMGVPKERDDPILQMAAITAERDEADRRAGAAERQLAETRESAAVTNRWLETAKMRAGRHRNDSFDGVFDELLLAKAELDGHKDGEAAMLEQYAPLLERHGVKRLPDLTAALIEQCDESAKLADDMTGLMGFYGVQSLRQLIEAQVAHVNRLQDRLRVVDPLGHRDAFPGTPRQG